MITPRFKLDQDEIFLIIIIRAPYCALKELETYIEDNDFRFICPPYYLRLNLPGKIVDNEVSSGKFDSDKGEFVFTYAKQTKGEHFEGLSFITSLLTPRRPNKQPQIEILNSDNNDDNDWFLEQNITEENLLTGCKYGFANQKSNILRNTEDEYRSVFDIMNADTTTLTDRKNQKYDLESMHFSEEHYLADYFESDEIKQIIKQQVPWRPELAVFTPQEIDLLKDFPNREYLLSEDEKKFVTLGLMDILYAYCYDQRTTFFEGTCESGWTIGKLSSTLSWFHVFENEKEVITSAFRRSIIYPLYRNFELSQKVFEDLKYALSLGELFIVKCLIEIYNFLNTSSDPRYILNDLYIKDYIIYMQKCDNDVLKQVIENVSKIEIKEEDLELNYQKIKVIKEGGEDAILQRLAHLTMADSSDSDETSDSDSESDSSEYTSSEESEEE